MHRHYFANTWKLADLMRRLDRVRMIFWLFGLSFFTIIVPLAYKNLYPTQPERDVMAETMENPAMTAMVGPGDLTHYTIGAMTSHQMLLLTAVVAGLMNIMLMNRHTRSEEEDGRLELIRSLPVGRLANLSASFIILCVLNGLLALIIGIGLSVLNITSMDLAGSLLYGLVLGAAGMFFAAVTAVTAQLTENARNAFGLALGLLLFFYLVRAIGDVGQETLSWISPFGWVTAAEVYTGNNWWTLLPLLGGSVLLFSVAGYLNAIRDLESGFLPSKPGKKFARRTLLSPIGLAFRLQRPGIIAWACGMLLVGLSYGSVMGDLETFFEGNEMLQQMMDSTATQSYTQQFMAMIIMVMALISTIPALMAILKINGEEKKNRIDHLLGRSVSRTRLMTGYLVIALMNGFVMLSFAVIGLWLAGVNVMQEPVAFGTVYGAGLAYYPALLVMVGTAVLIIGFIPKLSSIIWFYVLYSFVVLYFGTLFQFPDWVGQLSPFGHIPELPIDDMTMAPVIVLVIIAAGLTAMGMTGNNRRDIQGQ